MQECKTATNMGNICQNRNKESDGTVCQTETRKTLVLGHYCKARKPDRQGFRVGWVVLLRGLGFRCAGLRWFVLTMGSRV